MIARVLPLDLHVDIIAECNDGIRVIMMVSSHKDEGNVGRVGGRRK
jgi:hypothetical protein